MKLGLGDGKLARTLLNRLLRQKIKRLIRQAFHAKIFGLRLRPFTALESTIPIKRITFHCGTADLHLILV